MTRRRTLVACLALSALAVAALLASGSGRTSARVFALEAPNQFPLAVLRPHQQTCEGPVAGSGPVGGVSVWTAGSGGLASETVDAHDARTGAMLASGEILSGPGFAEQTARFSHSIAAGQPMRICLVADANPFTVAGSPAVAPRVTVSGLPAGHQFSLLLLSPARRSLLSWLPTTFRRASLWRPSWVGSWTFWVLGGGLLLAFVLGALAASATADEGGLPATPSEPAEPPPSPNGVPTSAPASSARR